MKLEKTIIELYSALDDNDKKDKHTSLHWNRKNKNKIFDEKHLINFRQDGRRLSYGLDDAWIEKVSNLLLDVLADVPSEFLFRALPKENIGNSNNVVKLKDCYVSGNDLVHIHWAYTLLEKIRDDFGNKKSISILEIGGGFGSLCRILERSIDISSYSIVELPLIACLAAYYLPQSIDASVNFNGTMVGTSNYEKSINIFTVDNESWLDNKYDLIINTRSMMEMDKDVIDYYFDAIQNVCKPGGYFLNINRYHKDSTGDDIEIAEFPYDENWTVIESKKSFYQGRIHYLLCRRESAASDIFSELSKIRKITQDYKKSLEMSLVTRLGSRLPETLQKKIRPLYRFIRGRS